MPLTFNSSGISTGLLFKIASNILLNNSTVFSLSLCIKSEAVINGSNNSSTSCIS
jgi:hypothetical protein